MLLWGTFFYDTQLNSNANHDPILFGKEPIDWSNLRSLEPELPRYLFARGKLPSGEFTDSSVSIKGKIFYFVPLTD
jgi:hypothetical protein